MTPRALRLAAPLLLAACASSADDSAAGGACGAPLTCADFEGASGLGPYEAGAGADLLPADFPAAPATATLCGAVTYSTGADSSAALVYFLNTGTDDALVSAYASSLDAAGYALGDVAPVEDGVGCHESAPITGGSVLPTTALFVYGGQGAFALGPFSAP